MNEILIPKAKNETQLHITFFQLILNICKFEHQQDLFF